MSTHKQEVKLELVPEWITHTGSLLAGRGLAFSFQINKVDGSPVETVGSGPLCSYLRVDAFDWDLGEYKAKDGEKLIPWLIHTIWKQLQPRLQQATFQLELEPYRLRHISKSENKWFSPHVRSVDGRFLLQTPVQSNNDLVNEDQFK